MYRLGLLLIPQEDLAYELGLTVPQKDVHIFERARTGKRPPAGWGTQIQLPEFDINKTLNRLQIPLYVEFFKKFDSVAELKERLQQVSGQNGDALVCFDAGVLWDLDVQSGHVCVFDQLDGDTVWLVDPERNVPKHRSVSIEKLFKAINFHGPDNSCGVWQVTAAVVNHG